MDNVTAALLSGAAIGLLFGFLLAAWIWYVMDKRITYERLARDRAVDIATRVAARTPITTIGIEEDKQSERESDELARRMKGDFEAMWADEVGEEPKNADQRLGAGVDLGDES
jgi:hypothetical protein